MIRLMFCFARREDVSRSEFRDYWRSQKHTEKVKSLVDIFVPDFYVENLSFDLPDIEEKFKKNMARGTHFDAVIEFYWQDPAIIRDRLADKAVTQIMHILSGHSMKRVDGEKSTVFFTEVTELPAAAMARSKRSLATATVN